MANTTTKSPNAKKVDAKDELVNMEILGVTHLSVGDSYEPYLIGKYKDDYYILKASRCTKADNNPLFLE